MADNGISRAVGSKELSVLNETCKVNVRIIEPAVGMYVNSKVFKSSDLELHGRISSLNCSQVRRDDSELGVLRLLTSLYLFSALGYRPQ